MKKLWKKLFGRIKGRQKSGRFYKHDPGGNWNLKISQRKMRWKFKENSKSRSLKFRNSLLELTRGITAFNFWQIICISTAVWSFLLARTVTILFILKILFAFIVMLLWVLIQKCCNLWRLLWKMMDFFLSPEERKKHSINIAAIINTAFATGWLQQMIRQAFAKLV